MKDKIFPLNRWVSSCRTLYLGLAVLVASQMSLGAYSNNTQTTTDWNKLALNLDDLGFDSSATQADPQLQKNLDLRSQMLHTHQRLGLWTAGAMALTLFSAGGSKDVHAALGLATAGLYFTTAFYALHAPEVKDIPHTGATKWHRRLAFIHLPAMIATPILGAMAKHQRDQGEHVHGIARLHPLAGSVAITSFLASIVVVSINF